MIMLVAGGEWFVILPILCCGLPLLLLFFLGDAGAMDRKIRIKRYQCDLDFAAHEARSGSHVLLKGKHVCEPTTILSAWKRERFCCTRSLCYHVMLFRVSGPGWVPLRPGAGFLLNDRYLEPGLSATLLLTLLIAGLHLRRHQQPGPFILSLVAGGSVFFAIYGIGWLPHAAGGDHMADGMATTPTWSPFLSYGAILVLLAAQVWDLWLFRRCVRRVAVPSPPASTDSAPVFPKLRKEGV